MQQFTIQICDALKDDVWHLGADLLVAVKEALPDVQGDPLNPYFAYYGDLTIEVVPNLNDKMTLVVNQKSFDSLDRFFSMKKD